MADEQANGAGLAPPSESIHLPGPTYLPVVIALFTTIALVGVVLNWIVFGISDGGGALLHRPLGPATSAGTSPTCRSSTRAG